MKLKARAKINLGLDVVRKREDGYHEVRMIMQTVRLCDFLEIRRSLREGVHLTTNLSFLPVDGGNLVCRAASLLMEEFGVQEGLEIRLTKRIPVAAGMAGGSSDAAAVLVGVNRIFDLGLSRKQLMERGVTIGADVPYCIMRGTALSEGIGEVLTELPPIPHCWILIGKPGIHVSTKHVYEQLKAEEICRHPDIDGMVRAIRENSLQGITSRMENVLEEVTIPEFPVIEQIRQLMLENGACGARMSGSGPTVFGIFDSREKAGEACRRLRKSGLARKTVLTEPFQNGGLRNE